jgi:hypothetical protein
MEMHLKMFIFLWLKFTLKSFIYGYLHTKLSQLNTLDCNFKCLIFYSKRKKSKAIPLQSMKALGGRGIAPTRSRPRHYMGVVSVTPRPRFTPEERTLGTLWTGGWVGPRAGQDTKERGKIFCPCRESNLDRPVVQSVARHYTD